MALCRRPDTGLGRNDSRSFPELHRPEPSNPAIFERLLPWNWFRTSYGVEKIGAILEKKIIPMKLAAIPDRPRYVLCSTDMAFGVNWMFKKEEMGDYQAGFASTNQNFPLARAVAASACFPPLFNPWPVDRSITKRLKGGMARKDPDYQSCISDLRLTDGGNHDNFGLEPVWKTCRTVLVSNGGSPFQHMGDGGLLKRFGRYVALWGNQVEAFRTRWLI